MFLPLEIIVLDVSKTVDIFIIEFAVVNLVIRLSFGICFMEYIHNFDGILEGGPLDFDLDADLILQFVYTG